MTASRVPNELARMPFTRAQGDPHGPCIRDDKRVVDNRAFAEEVQRLASRFESLGVSSGDTVAVMLPNRSEIVTSMFAAWLQGAAMTPVNPALTDDEVRFQLQDSAAVVVVGDERARVMAESMGVAWVDVDSIHEPAQPALKEPAPEPSASDVALVIYTSGTTGKPKGVLLDHGNLRAMSSSIIEHFALSATDTSLLVLPLFHVNGLVLSVISVLRAGGDVVVAPRFSAKNFWELVERSRPTYFSAVPTIYAILDAEADLARDRTIDTSSLRFVICGAAPMPADLIARIEERFRIPVVEGYGLSEGTVASTINPLAGPRKPGSVGIALPGQEVLVVEPSGEPVPPGHRGEVIVRGPNVMRGYLGKPEETAKVVRGGWLYTGDVGILDEEGYLRIVDRIKDMIIRGGENIYPKEIEECLYGHRAVLEVAVVGRPDAVLGEVPVAFVGLKPGATVTVEELLAHCTASLARYKVPAEIAIRAGLPKNSVGKIVKGTLRLWAAS